jgi:hypothetical protein
MRTGGEPSRGPGQGVAPAGRNGARLHRPGDGGEPGPRRHRSCTPTASPASSRSGPAARLPAPSGERSLRQGNCGVEPPLPRADAGLRVEAPRFVQRARKRGNAAHCGEQEAPSGTAKPKSRTIQTSSGNLPTHHLTCVTAPRSSPAGPRASPPRTPVNRLRPPLRSPPPRGLDGGATARARRRGPRHAEADARGRRVHRLRDWANARRVDGRTTRLDSTERHETRREARSA